MGGSLFETLVTPVGGVLRSIPSADPIELFCDIKSNTGSTSCSVTLDDEDTPNYLIKDQ